MISLRWDSGVLRSLGQALTVVLFAALFVAFPVLPTSVNASTAGSGTCQQTYAGGDSAGAEVSVAEDGGFCFVAFKNLGSLNTQANFTWSAPSG